MAISYRRLRNYLEMPDNPLRVFDMVQQLAVIDEDILDLFCVDTVEIGRAFLSEPGAWKPWTLPDGSECWVPSFLDVRESAEGWVLYTSSGKPSGIQKRGMLYFEQIEWPYIEGVPKNLEGLPGAVGRHPLAVLLGREDPLHVRVDHVQVALAAPHQAGLLLDPFLRHRECRQPFLGREQHVRELLRLGHRGHFAGHAP